MISPAALDKTEHIRNFLIAQAPTEVRHGVSVAAVIAHSTCRYYITISAGSNHSDILVLDSDYSMVIRLFTSFTPAMSLASLVARFNSAALLALPYKVTTPLFVSTLVFMALVER